MELYPAVPPLPVKKRPAQKAVGLKGMVMVAAFNRKVFGGLFKKPT